MIKLEMKNYYMIDNNRKATKISAVSSAESDDKYECLICREI